MSPPLFWARTVQQMRQRLAGATVSLDAFLNQAGCRSLKVSNCETQVKRNLTLSEWLPAVPGVHYVIRGWILGGTQLVGTACLGLYIQAQPAGFLTSTTIGAVNSLTTTAAAYTSVISGLAIVTEPNTAVTLGGFSGTPDTIQCFLYYDEVREDN